MMEVKMKIEKYSISRIALVVFSAFFLSSCSPLLTLSGGIPLIPAKEDESPALTMSSPESARDAVLDYLRLHYQRPTPVTWISWIDESDKPGDEFDPITYKYFANNWTVTVSYPMTFPKATIYTARVDAPAFGFEWLGLVDTSGQVVETSVTIGKEPEFKPDVPEQPRTPADTPIPTPTAMPPTPTPFPPTPTPLLVPCNAANFQADVTIPDGTKFAPGASFKKAWRVKNVGSCTWGTDYDLVFVEGERMNGKKAVGLPGMIRPGETLDISVGLTSPDEPGKYRGYWMFRSDSGEWFGIGQAANKAFWVEIKVVESGRNYQYDFALNFCAATWRSGEMRLPCPGYTTSREGFAVLLDTPRLENRQEDELALWVHPNAGKNSWLEGVFPSIEIDNGDHFQASVGCLEGNERCNLTFYLDYEDEDDKVHRLGEWTEVYDGEVSIIDVDLTNLADKSVNFILGVEANSKNVSDAHGFWFVPHIEREEAGY
jgi:hypothetical protein